MENTSSSNSINAKWKVAYSYDGVADADGADAFITFLIACGIY